MHACGHLTATENRSGMHCYCVLDLWSWVMATVLAQELDAIDRREARKKNK